MPRRLSSAGRGRSSGSSTTAGTPASRRFQNATSGARASSVSQRRCQAAKSAYWMASSGKGEGRPSRQAA